MSRFTRNTVLLAKREVTYGVDAVPTGAANAILLSNLTSKLSTNNVKRALIRPYFGNSEELVGTRWIETGFEVELVGSGTAGTAPAWSALATACALDEVVTAGRVDYLPITDGQDSVSAYVYRSGALHKSLGSRGKLSIGMKQGDIPKLKFSLMGLYGGLSEATPAGVDFSGFETPQVVNDENSLDLVIGGALGATGAPAVTGGTAYPSLGLELDLGLDVPMTALVGGETIDVTDRQATGKLTIDVTAAQEASLEASVLDNEVRSVAFGHGTVAGRKVLVFMPRVQFTNPQDEDLNGRMLKTYDLTLVPTSAGNDELRLVLY